MGINILSMIIPDPMPILDIMGIFGFILALLIPLIIALMIARFRSFFAAFWFIPCIIQLSVFLIANIKEINILFVSGNTILNGVLSGIDKWNYVVSSLHECVIYLLKLISSTNTIYVGVIESDIFAFILYLILFITFFIFFHKKKKRKKPKYDDDF